MEVPISELIDRMTIIKLKIERVGEPHLKRDFEEHKKSLQEYRKRKIKIKNEWFDKLYEINRGIWDLDFGIRDLVHKNVKKISKEEYKKIGRDSLAILNLMKERVAIKNKIVEETGIGFREIKVDHGSA